MSWSLGGYVTREWGISAPFLMGMFWPRIAQSSELGRVVEGWTGQVR